MGITNSYIRNVQSEEKRSGYYVWFKKKEKDIFRLYNRIKFNQTLGGTDPKINVFWFDSATLVLTVAWKHQIINRIFLRRVSFQ